AGGDPADVRHAGRGTARRHAVDADHGDRLARRQRRRGACCGTDRALLDAACLWQGEGRQDAGRGCSRLPVADRRARHRRSPEEAGHARRRAARLVPRRRGRRQIRSLSLQRRCR
ncbi:hypothetical protein LTR94_035526, partial [Friedmanniomyces endolithicus]